MKTRSFIKIIVLVAASLALVMPASLFAATQEILVNAFGSPGSSPDYINQFELFGNGLFWTEGYGSCTVEFHSDSKIGIQPILKGATRKMMSDCSRRYPAAVRTDGYIYFVDDGGPTDNGRLYRKALSASTTDPAEEIPAAPYAPLPKGGKWAMGAMMTWNERVYWSYTDGTYFNIISMKEDGTDMRYELLGTAPGIKKMVGYSYFVSFGSSTDAFFLLTENGQLLRYDVNPRATHVTLLAEGVTDFAIREESTSSGFPFPLFTRSTAVYASAGQRFQIQPSTPPGTVIRINASTVAKRVVFSSPGGGQVTSIAADDTGVYIVEQPVLGCGDLFGCQLGGTFLKRQSNPSHNGNNSASFDLIETDDAVYFNLRSDGQWLNFIRGTQIRRLRTDAPALQIDVQADNIEVVQAVQSLNNDVTLVAGKRTFARGYAHLPLNTTGKSDWFPGAQLRAFRGGTELSGSPLDPVSGTSVNSSSDLNQKRPDVTKTFLFELPQNWLQAGPLRIEFVVDPGHSIPETVANPFNNNSVSTPTMTVVSKAAPCLVFVPLWNKSGDYDPFAPSSRFGELMERTKSLMPVPDFQVFFSPARIEKPVVHVEFHPECFIPFTFCLPVQVKIQNEPFSMPDDKTWALVWTTVFNAFNKNPSGCPDTHWVGTLPAAGQGGFNGIGGASGVKIGDLVDLGPFNGIGIPATPLDSTTVVRMDPGQGNSGVIWDRLNGGHTLAHELGHNYGRFHIDQGLSSRSCGPQRPDRPWQTYPWDPCTLGPISYTDPASYFGFDPITRTAIPPDMAGDTMSYADSHWTSKFFWDALLAKVPNPPPPAPSTPPPPAPALALQAGGQYLMLSGNLNVVSNTVQLVPALVVPGDVFDPTFLQASLSALQALPATLPYRVRLIGGVGQVLAEKPLRLLTGVDASDSVLPFLQLMPFDALTDRIQLWNGNDLIAEQWVSFNKPTLALDTPVYDAVQHRVRLSWSASDLDGDPLTFSILFSPDNGVSWQMINPSYNSLQISIDSDLLPGGNQTRLRVIATDGVNTTLADTAPFALPLHAPKVVISGVVPGQRFTYGTPIQFTGFGYQPEYGTVPPNRLSWTLLGLGLEAVQGTSFLLPDVAPGSYTVQLVAVGSDGRRGTNSIPFQIQPLVVADGAAPELDGLINDPGYAGAASLKIDLGARTATVRLLHADGFLYLSASDLSYGTLGKSQFTARFDTSADGGTSARVDDVGFVVDQDGFPAQEVAQGGVFKVTSQPKPGYSVTVSQGASSWSLEMKISEALLGGWGHLVGASFSHERFGLFPATSRWPLTALPNAPGTWAPISLGPVVAPGNRAPVAAAGPSQVRDIAAPVTIALNGSSSFDPDGDAITYAWSQVAGPSVSLTGATTATPTFTASIVSQITSLRFRLIVNDGKLNSVASETDVQLVPTYFPDVGLTGPTQRTRPDGSFAGELTALGTLGERFAIQASSDFKTWVTIGTQSLNYLYQLPFIDPDAKLYPHRFYRAVELGRTETSVYFNNFEAGVGNEWTLKTLDQTPEGGRKFLGQFDNQAPRLQLGGLPTHNRITLEFDVYVILTWDGNDPTYGPDRFGVKLVGGSTLVNTTFACSISQSTQTYPGDAQGSYPPLTGATEHGTLGYLWGESGAVDAVYHFSVTFDHSASSLQLEFAGSGLQGVSDESWGLDNVSVKAINNP